MPPVSARHDFKPAQQRALALLRDGRERALTRGAYQAFCDVSRSQAAYDLAELVEAGVLERVGGGRSTRYVLVSQPNSTRRHWTSDRIRAELAHFCEGRTEWPSAREFKAAGRADLYVAASRYGGIGFWAGEVGLPRGPRGWEARPLARLRLSLSWAMIGAIGGALGVAGAFAIVQGFPRDAPAPVAQQARSVAAPKTSAGKSSRSHPQAQKTVKHTASTAPKFVKRTPTHRAQAASKASSSSGTAVLAVRTVSSTSPRTSSAPTTSSSPSSTSSRTTSSSTPSTSSGPTPLMAPRQSGSGTPPPLPPPTP